MNNLKVTELKEIAKNLGVKNWWLLKKDELIKGIEEKNKELRKLNKDLGDKVTKEMLVKEIPVEESSEDLVTLKEIISELGIKGTKARRILRNLDIERPYKRWEWHKEEHKDIIKAVKGYLRPIKEEE